jgi:hypothetical protein
VHLLYVAFVVNNFIRVMLKIMSYHLHVFVFVPLLQLKLFVFDHCNRKIPEIQFREFKGCNKSKNGFI